MRALVPNEVARSGKGLELVAALFLRGLGLVYACAFLSLWVQIEALIGARGIAPAAELLAFARDRLGGSAPLALPTLLWISGASDWALHGLCAFGVLAALALVLGRAPFIAAFGAWLTYLSLACVGDVFTSFQWDALLLESGLVALFAASPEPRLGVWLARALLFKLMFLSGAVKLLSGDPTWRDLSALSYHFWTQPLPTPTSALAAALPGPVLRAATALTLAVELGAPWAVLGPRRVRLASAALLAGLQVLIAATGNYGFFNLLTLVLCASLLDDADLARLSWLRRPAHMARGRIPLRVAAVALGLASAIVGLERLTPASRFPNGLRLLVAPLEPLRSVSSYGLFAVMTTERPEISIEGSSDGVTWRAYEFRWKPGALERAPRFAGPHMPRVDWQMWFAALGRCEHELWFQRLLLRLLEGSPTVTGLLASDPFAGEPPRFLRTTLERYRFATRDEGHPGDWWTRSDAEPYCPIVTLRDGHLAAANELPR